MTQTVRADVGIADDVNDQPVRSGDWRQRFARPARALRAVPHVGIYAGVVTVAAGAVLIFVAWVKTAALTNVALQIPYVISAGFTGLALVALGLTVVNVSVKREEASERRRQTGELAALVSELRRTGDSERAE